jgi:GH24 family phage-related lysozyme (muramidase)
MDLRQTAIDRTKHFEGWVPYFYLDTRGNVTVGYGQMLGSADAAVGIVMQSATGIATDAEKSAEWTTIKGKPWGTHGAGFYQPFTKLTYDEAIGAQFLTGKLQSCIDALALCFPDLDSYPPGPQDALLDMMYNMGAGEFSEDRWPHLFAAVEAKDWATAAQQCTRQGIGDERNNATRALFTA